MTSKLLKDVYKIKNLEASWRVIHDNARTSRSEDVKREIEKYAENAGSNLRSLAIRLAKGTFKFPLAKGIPSPKFDQNGKKTGKIRPIVLAPVEARIVQRALLNVLVSVSALKPYFETPFSFGGIRKAKVAGARSRRDNPSAVPAAIQAVLNEIGCGATHFVAADIRSFFTCISKIAVLSIISDAVKDSEFIEFLERAITVELSNLAELKQLAKDFPTSDIGVAQGNSLSPLLGNITLAEFDKVMNQGDCRCIRYIDDFLILAPRAKAANARLRKADAILKGLHMELSPDKTSKGAQKIENGLVFLGIEVLPGLIRPSHRSRQKLLSSIEFGFTKSRRAFEDARCGKRMQRARSLIATLKRVDGMIEGWGKHYWFCNDNKVFAELNSGITKKISAYLASYRNIRSRTADAHHRSLMGIAELRTIERDSFQYPMKHTS